jgi:broad specificity phosphatase PhoE
MRDFQSVFSMLNNANLNLPKAMLFGEETQISHGMYGVALRSGTAEERKEFARVGYGARNGETHEEFHLRIQTFLAEVEKLDCKKVAAFAHAGWLRSMLDLVVGTVLPRDAVCCNNCTIAVFEYTGSKWRLHSWMNLME